MNDVQDDIFIVPSGRIRIHFGGTTDYTDNDDS